MPYQQLENYAVCSICGDFVPMENATPNDCWLVAPLRSDPSWTVVRCPAHISEWAMRRSTVGRTKFWRARMEEGRNHVPDPVRHLKPFPYTDKPETG